MLHNAKMNQIGLFAEENFVGEEMYSNMFKQETKIFKITEILSMSAGILLIRTINL